MPLNTVQLGDRLLMDYHRRPFGHLCCALILLCLFPISCVSQFVSTGFSVSLSENLYYFVSPYTSGSVSNFSVPVVLQTTIQGHLPVTVVQGEYTTSELSSLFQNWTDIDDVFHDAFTQSELHFSKTIDKLSCLFKHEDC